MASHEMQTPIAVCQNRIEMLLDDEGLNEQQMGDLIKVRQTLQQLSRLNKSLLMLCKIENGHFSANEPQNLTMITERLLTDYQAVYASQDVRVELHDRKPFVLNMDENLASMLVANLLKMPMPIMYRAGRYTLQLQPTVCALRIPENRSRLTSRSFFNVSIIPRTDKRRPD